VTLPADMCLSTYLLGAIFGCALALLCVTLVNRSTSSRRTGQEKSTVLAGALSRRERAEKVLKEMREQQTAGLRGQNGLANGQDTRNAAAGASATEGVNDTRSNSTGSSSSDWASTSEMDDDEDSEYERMEELQLKMVFVVRHPVQPKMSAQEVAVLTATAGVQLVESHQRDSRSTHRFPIADRDGNTAAAADAAYAQMSFTPTEEDQQRWLHWYLWWNRIGCAKITLKCPGMETMEEVVRTAAEKRLPVVRLRRSQFSSVARLTTEAVVPVTLDEMVVVAIGPAPSDVLEPVTGALKLFS
jgi:peptidyl-tRNA hydrolase